MKFASVCPLMFLAAASALELPSTFTYDNMFQSSRFNNRFSWKTRAAGSNIIDRNGWATGTPATFTSLNANWFGGCRFKPAKMFEEYHNQFIVNAGAASNHVPAYKNKRLSGIATYRCADNNAATGEGGQHQCYMSARIRGFYWDYVASTPAVALGGSTAGGITTLNLYHPQVWGTTATGRIDADDYEMTEYCTIRQVDVAGTMTDAGTVDPFAANEFAGDGTVETTLTDVSQATFRLSNFVTTEVTDNATPNDSTVANWESVAASNTSWNKASVFLSFHTALAAFDTTNVALIMDGQPEWEALHAHGKVPNIACCKLEQWPKRTYMRYTKSILDYRTRICADTTKKGVTLSCQVAAPI